jgi:hypothetical protein
MPEAEASCVAVSGGTATLTTQVILEGVATIIVSAPGDNHRA